MPEEQINEIANAVNGYIDSKDLKFTENIRQIFGKLFNVEKVRFWKYNASENTLSIFGSHVTNTLTLTDSITKESIVSKMPILANHVFSNKYYMSEIDNPLHLKIKSLLVFPIIKESQVIGVLKLWRGVNQKALFKKQDEQTLQIIEPLLCHLFEETPVSEEALKKLYKESKKSSTLKDQSVSHTRVSDGKKKKSPENSEKLDVLTQVHEKSLEKLSNLEELYVKSQERIAFLEESLKQNEEILKEYQYLKADLKLYEKKEASYQHQINENITSMDLLEENYKKQFEKMQLDYKVKYKELDDEIEALKYANTQLKEEKQEHNKQIIKLRSEVTSSSQKSNFGKLDENMEWLFKEYDNVFGDKESAFIMFEMLIYALDSQKGLACIDEMIQESKLLPLLMDGYYFKGNIDVFNEKTLISDIVKHIQGFKKSIFFDTCQVDINTDEKMPISLVLDTPKIQNIIYHLLSDLKKVADPGQTVTVSLKYEDKLLKIEIDGMVHLQDTLFKSFFKQKKMNNYEKDKPGLILSRKLIERLKGSLEFDCINEHYKYNVSLPVQVIKM